MRDPTHKLTNEPPHLGVRRWGDACFHPVEEEVPEGYIVDGFLFARDEVCEVLDLTTGRVSQRCPLCHNDERCP